MPVRSAKELRAGAVVVAAGAAGAGAGDAAARAAATEVAVGGEGGRCCGGNGVSSVARAEGCSSGGAHSGEAIGRKKQDANSTRRRGVMPNGRRGGAVGEGVAGFGERERMAGASRGGVRGRAGGGEGGALEGGVVGAAWRFALGSSGTTGRRGAYDSCSGGSGGRPESVSSRGIYLVMKWLA